MADGPVVSNTTPLIVLSGIGHLALLRELYGEVWIAESVYEEFQTGRSFDEPDLKDVPWIAIHSPPASEPFFAHLDRGEADAIRLALAVDASAVLLDERLGRRTAQRLGMPVVGSLAVLLRAKQQGLIPTVLPLVERMIAQGRYLSEELRRQVLEAAGELPANE